MYSQEEAESLIATNRGRRNDELLTKLMAEFRRRLSGETTDQLSDGVIDFDAIKIQAAGRRFQEELAAERERWERLRNQLIAVMEASGLDLDSLSSVTLSALLELMARGEEA